MLQIQRQTTRKLIFFCLALLTSKSVFAEKIDLQVVDQDGLPAANVVISFTQNLIPKQSQTMAMDQVNKQFSPRVLVVQKDQLVDFPNSDDIRHHVYSFSQPNQFEIKLFSGSEAQPIAFQEAGVVVLGCNIHDNMVGYIYVNDGKLTAMTDKQGILTVEIGSNADANGTEPIEINVWHPELSPMQSNRLTMTLPGNERSHIITLPISLAVETPDIETSFKKKFGH